MSLVIVNRCLNLMGAKSVVSISDTDWSQVLDGLVAPFYSILLFENRWDFSTKMLELNKSTVNNYKKYKFEYILPSDFVRIYELYLNENTDTAPYKIKEHEYNIISNRLYTNYEPITISYVSDSVPVNSTPESFKLALSYKILANVAASLMNNPQMVKFYQEMATRTLNDAINLLSSNLGALDTLTMPRRYL